MEARVTIERNLLLEERIQQVQEVTDGIGPN
jgi:hypothetical protein